MIEGACLCGAVRYEADGPLQMMLHCHCSMCRKHHGAPFATFTAVPFQSFRWISGEDSITSYRSSEKFTRDSCKLCGSVVPTPAPEMGEVILPAGNLHGDLGKRPEMHIFVGSKAPWYTIADDLPQHATWPPAFAGAACVDRPPPEVKPGLIGGSCLCGDVAFEIEGELMWMWYCHCSRCRRARSAAHGANVFAKPEQFRWLRGESQVRTYKVPDARHYTIGFCSRCGGSAPVVAAARGIAIIPGPMLDSDPGVRPRAHIFVASKASWFEITDDVAQYETVPPRPA